MSFVTIEQQNYHYVARYPRSSDPEGIILFVHGAGGSHQDWRYQVEYLGQRYLAIALDLPGHGESEGQSMSSIEDYTEFIEKFADRVIGSPFVLTGHSMGGAIAMNFVARHPGLLTGLVLVGTGARLKVAPAILNTFAEGKLFRQLVDYMFRKEAPRDLLVLAREEMEKVSPRVFYNDFSACNRFDLTGQLDSITVKTLVISAEEDSLTPLKYGQYLNEHISGSELQTIPEAGHMMMLEQPETVNRVLENFLAGGSN